MRPSKDASGSVLGRAERFTVVVTGL